MHTYMCFRIFEQGMGIGDGDGGWGEREKKNEKYYQKGIYKTNKIYYNINKSKYRTIPNISLQTKIKYSVKYLVLISD